jgi:hemerythrin-like metal-binding protein
MPTAVSLPEWAEVLSVGINDIDKQHKELVALAHRLAEALAGAITRPALLATFDEMIAYAKAHFATEEASMAEFEFEELAEHRTEHRRFCCKMEHLRRGLAVARPNAEDEVLDFLGAWITHHIRKVDARYAGCFLAHGPS